jgi:hypothetical protein
MGAAPGHAFLREACPDNKHTVIKKLNSKTKIQARQKKHGHQSRGTVPSHHAVRQSLQPVVRLMS